MAPKTIILKGDPIRKEALAHEELTPGMLVEFYTDGTLQKHATAGGDAQPRFVVEEDFVGDGIAVTFAAAEQVQYVVPRQGDEILAWAATSQTIKKGDALDSNGAGLLRKHTAQAVAESGSASYNVYADAIVAYAAEDKTTTSAAARIKVEVA
jgi:hypothetical protein